VFIDVYDGEVVVVKVFSGFDFAESSGMFWIVGRYVMKCSLLLLRLR
jgi:hypothetical protein